MSYSNHELQESYTSGPGVPRYVRCPRCAKRALYDSPFRFYPKNSSKPIDEGLFVRETEHWFVVEKYPSILPYSLDNFDSGAAAVVNCPSCTLAAPYRGRWPEDAYYQWNIRGALLWATDPDHARAIAAFVGASHRDYDQCPKYKYSLRQLPKEVISAKNRDYVVKLITQTLEKEKA